MKVIQVKKKKNLRDKKISDHLDHVHKIKNINLVGWNEWKILKEKERIILKSIFKQLYKGRYKLWMYGYI